jgi:hypothetical protein
MQSVFGCQEFGYLSVYNLPDPFVHVRIVFLWIWQSGHHIFALQLLGWSQNQKNSFSRFDGECGESSFAFYIVVDFWLAENLSFQDFLVSALIVRPKAWCNYRAIPAVIVFTYLPFNQPTKSTQFCFAQIQWTTQYLTIRFSNGHFPDDFWVRFSNGSKTGPKIKSFTSLDRFGINKICILFY